MRKLNILIGCECSGIVRDEFIKLGHNAMSCDLQPCDRPGPHHQGDLLELLKSKPRGYYDLMIAHPVCTYLCGSGWHWHKKDPTRMAKSVDAREFFMRLWNHPACKHVVLENPIGIMSSWFRKPDVILQPWMAGDDASKATCLWMSEGLPKIVPNPADFVLPRITPDGKKRWANQLDSGQNRLGPSADRAKLRSQTYPGLARLIATQMSEYLS